MAGGQSGGVESYLPIAAALAATIATDGAASPWLVEAMGATAAGAVTSGAAAAAASGLTAGVLGQDAGRAALMGGITGGIGGGLAGAAAPIDSTAAAMGGSGGGGAFVPAAGSGASFGVPVSGAAAFTPTAGPQLVDAVSGPISGVGASGAGPTLPSPAVTPPGTPPATASGGIGKLLADNKGIAALGGTAALGYLMQKGNDQYGTPPTETYDGPLSDFSYDRKKYTPLEATPPNPPYRAQYANYVRTPYNAYAARGGKVVAMADGGIAMANPSIGPVEQMSRNNAMGNNQMFPQAGINSPSFASATNTPMSQNIVSGISDAAVDPYTGAQRFAEGGTTQASEAIPLQAMPNLITQNAVGNNNALTQDLVSRMAARNAMNPVPGQTPPVAPMQPAGIMAAAPYTAPTFTRPTNVAPIEFQNPGMIVGTKAYNDEQARLAAEEAARQNFMSRIADAGGDSGGGAGGGLMPNDLRYSGGGKTASSNMAAIDDYMAQYQSDPASVTAKAKSGDWNAMIALNKIKGTPNQNYAAGGHLGGYSDGGRMLKGPGDGMSDNIPATIGGKQPARLADGEFVVPADVVSHLGNGSTDAGAKHLYAMMDKVRKARTGTKKQGKQIKPAKYLKA